MLIIGRPGGYPDVFFTKGKKREKNWLADLTTIRGKNITLMRINIYIVLVLLNMFAHYMLE